MKRLMFLSLVLLTACGPSVKVGYDYDRGANFGQYKTYTSTSDALSYPINELNRQRVLAAIESELNAKGLSKSDNGDLLVDIKLTAERQQTATATNTGGPYGAGYGYRWGGGFSTTQINVETYIEGTLFIDLIDNAKKQLVWQGRGVKTLDKDATPDQRDQRIKEAVNLIMKQYPPAGKK
ncbi:MAG: DUF4136 domain-containing protein [Bacteroidetes bacterium]|nr:DUF4136 domain-containing protein [Bacteroidota bacterium]